MKLSLVAAILATAVLVAYSRTVPVNKHLEKIQYEYNENLFQGDILVNNEKGAASFSSLLARRWDKGVVPYVIGAEFSERDRQIILDGLKHVEDKTRRDGKDCIKFIPRTTETQYVSVFNGTGCYSYVGRQILMNGQQLSIRSPGCNYVGVVAHEFMHALGFFHEQSRNDRDNYIKVNTENVIEGTENNFDKLSTSQNDQLLQFKYDYGSLMHYDAFAFSKNGKPTIEVLQEDVFIGQRDGLSEQDAEEIRRMYNC